MRLTLNELDLARVESMVEPAERLCRKVRKGQRFTSKTISEGFKWTLYKAQRAIKVVVQRGDAKAVGKLGRTMVYERL